MIILGLIGALLVYLGGYCIAYASEEVVNGKTRWFAVGAAVVTAGALVVAVGLSQAVS